MNKIKEFDFGFENCEVMRFDNENIEIFNLDKIYTHIQQLRDDWVKEYKVVNYVCIVLKPNANTEKHNSSFAMYGYDSTPFQRITRYDDITSIGVTYLNDEGIEMHEEYYPVYNANDWNGEENTRQLSIISDKGYLIILINKDVEKNRDKAKGEVREQLYWLFNDIDNDDDDD